MKSRVPLEIAADRSAPIKDRIKAIEVAAQAVSSKGVAARAEVWTVLGRILFSDDEPVAIREAAAWAGRHTRECAVNNLVAYTVPHFPTVRAAMTRALAEIGSKPMEPFFEARLAEDQQKLGAEHSLSPTFVNLTLSYGADARVKRILHQGLGSPVKDLRQSAMFQLSSIGDLEPAVQLLQSDPESQVREAAANALGYYWTGDSAATEALAAAANGSDTAVAKAARTARRRLGLEPIPRPGPFEAGATLLAEIDPRFAWRAFLRRWSWQLLHVEAFVLQQEDTVVRSGWLGHPGADETELAELEVRLGRTLPPSYRSFLVTTNGFRGGGMSIARIRPTQEVKPFVGDHEDWVDAWTSADDPEISLEQHIADRSDPVRARWSLLKAAVQVSDMHDGAVYLLCPDVVDQGGEWEAWFVASWLPGASRYASWWEMLQDEYRSFVRTDNPPEPD